MAEVATIPAYILSNENLLDWMLHVPLTTPFQEAHRNYLKEFVYLEFHGRNSTRPDHVFRHRWEKFIESYCKQQGERAGKTGFQMADGECSLVLACLECLKDEYIEFSHGSLHIYMERFGWWQNMLSRMSALPVQAHAIWRTCKVNPAFEKNAKSIPLVFYPYDEGVENYISRYGLNDSHLHVNLIASSEICWLNALVYPEREWKAQQKQFDTIPEVVELYREIHVNLTPFVLREHIDVARRLRCLLLHYADNAKYVCRSAEEAAGADCYSDDVSGYLRQIAHTAPLSWTDEQVMAQEGAPIGKNAHNLFHMPDVEDERWLLERVLENLSQSADVLMDRVLHLYILLKNEFYMLCVQRDNLYGFKQFQKYSHIVSSVTKSAYYYEHVFRTLHGPSRNSVTNYAELRIAPQDSYDGNIRRIGGILSGYFHYLSWIVSQESVADAYSMNMDDLLQKLNAILKHPELKVRVVRPVIVLHFIKQPWSLQTSKEKVRYAYLRSKNKKILYVLERIFAKYPMLLKWVRGIDAAADEMDAPPDVFAVPYRMVRSVLGIRHATYHAGEDFYHLISGMRNIYDAVEMLEFQRGDRIGHGTALGVKPDIWLQTMPHNVTPTRGEWLQDLVFLWKLLHESVGLYEVYRRLNRDIMNLAYAVFKTSDISPLTLSRIFELQSLDPLLLDKIYEETEDDLLRQVRAGTLSPRTMIDRKAVILHMISDSVHIDFSSDWEAQLIHRAIMQETPDVISLLMQWQGDENVIREAGVRIEVPAEYLSVKELIFIQQQVMNTLAHKGIVLETLPTSNLRIGQYREMGQHHSLRWLGIGAYEQDSPPPIVLGTDDPGVFATDIKAEFYHLFASLCKRGLNAQAALNLMSEVNENGNRYAFRTLVENDSDYADKYESAMGWGEA